MMCVNQIIMLYTLNLHRYLLYLNKTKRNIFFLIKIGLTIMLPHLGDISINHEADEIQFTKAISGPWLLCC